MTQNNIKYVCNPATFIKPEGENIDIRQAQLFCYNCSCRVNITEENSKTLPSGLFVLPDNNIASIDQIIFNCSPLYSGICLRPECGPIKNINYEDGTTNNK